MSVFFSPIQGQFEDSSGNPASGWKIYTYAAGSSTPLTSYTTSAGSVAQANPIVLNSLGFPASAIWLTGGLSYKLVLTNAADVSQKEWDNVSGVGDSATTQDQWIASGLTPTYVSATSFTLVGDQTTAFHVGRRLKTTNSGGTIYSRIITSAFTALTTITVVNDSGVLDSGLSAVSYGLLTTVNPSVPALNQIVLVPSGSNNADIFMSTADAADTARLRISGGGSAANTRGGFIILNGNENAGEVEIESGDLAAAHITMTSGTAVAGLLRNGGFHVGDVTANAKNLVGVTIQQLGADDEIESWKSSDVAHGVTDVTETDTYGLVRKRNGAGGGVEFVGVRETGGPTAMSTIGYADAADTTASTSANAITMTRGFSFSGTAVADVAANTLVWGVTTRKGGAEVSIAFIDEDGDIFVDGSTTITSFDAHNDAHLCRAMDTVLKADGVVKSEWDRFVKEKRADLERLGIITKPKRGKGAPMRNITRLQQLHNGAIWQGYERDMLMAREIETLKSQLFDMTKLVEELKGLLPR